MRQPIIWQSLLLAAILLFPSQALSSHSAEEHFPRPPELEPFVEFWIEIFTRLDRDWTIIHDKENPAIRYEKVCTAGMSDKERSKFLKYKRRHYTKILEDLALKRPERWSEEEKKIAAFFPKGKKTRRFLQAAGRIRSQRGIRDQFRDGMIRSGRWKRTIEGILNDNQIPVELSALPLIESAYNPHARSKAGAVGIWQFTSKTGRKYLRIDRHVDERRDVYASTGAAAQYLKDAYSQLGSWPLTVTSYNHGVNGMLRAKRELGTNDIVRLIREYDGPYFGFASKNFYAEFLAAIEVVNNPHIYFGKLRLERHESIQRFALPAPAKFSSLTKAFGVPSEELKRLNPAISSRVISGRYGVPSGTVINIPTDAVSDPAAAFQSLPESERSAALEPSRYKVRWGDTLTGIAKRHKVSVSDLQAANGLGRSTKIRAGQRLTIPPATR